MEPWIIVKTPPWIIENTLTVLAAVAVILLASLTVKELLSAKKLAESEEDNPKFLSPNDVKRVSIEKDYPQLSIEEALKLIDSKPNKVAVKKLWESKAHRERLFKLLVLKEIDSELRIYLLWKFEAEDLSIALKAAREISKESEPPSALLLTAFLILSQNGCEEDLFLLAERESEPYQFKTLRKKYREYLHDRVHGN